MSSQHTCLSIPSDLPDFCLDFFLHPQPTCAWLPFPLSVTPNLDLHIAIIPLHYYWAIALHHSWPLPSPLLPQFSRPDSPHPSWRSVTPSLRFFIPPLIPSPTNTLHITSTIHSIHCPPLCQSHSLPLPDRYPVCTFAAAKHSHSKSILHVKHPSPTFISPINTPDSLAPFPSSSEPSLSHDVLSEIKIGIPPYT